MKTHENRINRSSTPVPQGPVSAPETILVPIDFSPASKAALLHAIRLAPQYSGTIILLHVIETLPLQAAISYVPHEVRKAHFQLVRHAEAVLGKLAEQTVNARARSKVVVRIGVPYKLIADVAREMAADLILVGTDDHGGLKRRLLGSTAELVVRHATCNVLVLRVPTPVRGRRNQVPTSPALFMPTGLAIASNASPC
jgi:universal stress protein A